jgi:hypothetical protein
MSCMLKELQRGQFGWRRVWSKCRKAASGGPCRSLKGFTWNEMGSLRIVLSRGVIGSDLMFYKNHFGC